MRPGPEASGEQLLLLAEVHGEPLVEVLIGVGGLLWIATYLLIVRRGFIDHACGMPLPALAVNFAWELMWGVVLPDKPPMDTVNQVWAAVDLVIVAQYLRWGRADWPRFAPASWFVPSVVFTFGAACALVYFASYEWKDWEVGGAYVAWLDNIMMSALFLHWAMTRDHVRGQSLWIGLTKGLGTLLLAYPQIRIDDVVVGGSPFLISMMVVCGVLDLAYLVLLHRRMRALGIERPWRRL